MSGRQIALCVQTTGFTLRGNNKDGPNRIVSISAIELKNNEPTGKHFHRYIDPQSVSIKRRFEGIADQFIKFIQGAKLIIFDARFVSAFLNQEFALAKKKKLNEYCPQSACLKKMAKARLYHYEIRKEFIKNNVLDARVANQLRPFSFVVLCQYFNIDLTYRRAAGNLLDCRLSAKLYSSLLNLEKRTVKSHKRKLEESSENQEIAAILTKRSASIIRLRDVDYGDHFPIPDQDIHHYKIAILMEKDTISIKNPDRLADKFGAISTHRPVKKIIKSKNGLPERVLTPGLTPLDKHACFGPFSFFSNSPSNVPINRMPRVTVIDKWNKFLTSQQFQALKQFQDDVKLKTVRVTTPLLKETYEKYKENGFVRKTTQQKVMIDPYAKNKQVNAKDYVDALELFINDVDWEFLHMIAYMIYGEASQCEDNIVIGTKHSNSQMMFIESTIGQLTEAYPDGFTLKVEAKMVQPTQIAQMIYYTIITEDFTLPLTFDPQALNRPHLDYMYYFRAIVGELIEQANEKRPVKRSKTEVAKNKGILFYTEPRKHIHPPSEEGGAKRRYDRRSGTTGG